MRLLYLPLRYTIPLGFFIMISGAGFLQFLNETAKSSSNVERNIENYAKLNGVRIAETLERFYIRKDYETAESALAMEGSQPNLRVALLMDERGEALISTNYEYRGKKPLKEWDGERAEFIQSVKAAKRGTFHLTEDGLSAIAAFAVNLGARADELRPSRMGVLYMEYDLASLKKDARAEGMEDFFAHLCIDGLLSVCAWLFLTLAFTGRMRRMEDSVSRLASGDYSARVDLAGRDELAAVGAAFNQMAAKLENDILEMRKKDRIMRMLSDCNQMLIRVTDEIELLQSICGIIVQGGGYKMAWVGYKEDGGEKRVLPMAQVGFEEGYLASIKVTWGDDKYGSGPIGTAIKTRKSYVMSDMANNPAFALWRDEALKRGYASGAAIPLISGKEVIGIIAIYSPEKHAFDVEEIKLLEELGDDLAFGIMVIRGQAERKMAEEIKQETLLRFQKIASQVPGIVYQYLLRPDGSSCFPYASEAIRDIYRVAPEEAARDASKVYAILHPDDYAGIVASIQKSALDLSPWIHEYRVKYDDGVVRWLSGNATPQREADGSTLWHGFIRDITERRLVEEALRQSEAKFRTIFDSTSEAVMLLDEKGFLDCNRATLEMFGCATREEFCSKHPADLSPPSQPCGTDSMTLANQRIATAMEEGTHNFEWEHMRADTGKTFPAEVLLNAMTLDGRPILEAVVRDITERKLAEAALRESEEKYHALFEKHMDMILVYDAASRVVEDVNQACVETFGYSKEDFLKLKVKDITAGWDETEGALNELLEETGSDGFGEVKIPAMYAKRKDGSIFPLELGLNHFVSGGRKKIVISSRDITDTVLTEKNMRTQRRHLLQADRLKSLGTLVAGVAHEINNPNSFIMFNGPMIRKAWDGVIPILEKYYAEHGDFSAGGMPFTRLRDSAPRLIDDMLAGSRRISRIVDKLKGFARQSGGEIHKPVDMNRVLKDAAWLLSPVIGKSTRLFITNYAEDLPPVMGDLSSLEQVVVNLVSNALQSLKSEEDMVRVSTRFDAESNCVILEVRDEGVGIPAGHLDKIMDPFYTTKREKGGMGLGLSISYGIIQEHNGTIKFESEDRMGTTVTVSLPAHLEQ
jgi:hypothetical protein